MKRETIRGRIRIRQWGQPVGEERGMRALVCVGRATLHERRVLHQRRARRPLDEFHFVAVRRVDKDEAAAGGGFGRAVGDSDLFGFQRPDRVVQVLDLKGEVHQVFLHGHRSAGGKAAQFDEFLAVRYFEEREVRPTRRDLALQYLQAQYVLIEADRLIHVADPHAGVEEFCDFHTRSL
ncbi:hypothetical protein NSND_61429 [Nitrospira sp. ND1]|nr:hypothetical protein NSND_61429 [Nitrospira sp. ND1]